MLGRDAAPRATRAGLLLDYSRPAAVRLEVRDDGAGFAAGDSAADAPGFGPDAMMLATTSAMTGECDAVHPATRSAIRSQLTTSKRSKAREFIGIQPACPVRDGTGIGGTPDQGERTW